MLPELDAHLKRQHNVITRQQCIGAGLTPRRIDRLLTANRLEAVFHGVFRDPATKPTIDQRAMAAALAGGRNAWVSHRMAVDVWKMRNDRCDLSEILSTRTIAHPGMIAHRCRTEPETTKARGIPVTTPARTMLDCGSVLSKRALGRFLEIWLSTGVPKLAELEAVVDRHSRHPGARCLNAAIADRMITSEEPDSPAEFDAGCASRPSRPATARAPPHRHCQHRS